MALKIYQPGIQPLGQFDVLDSYASLIKGGEVGTLFAASRTVTTSEKAAYDVLDGYTNTTDVQRAGVAPRCNDANARPLWLLDEGIAGYGTLFGTLIGSPVGLCTGQGTGASCVTTLGPTTLAGSGKVTCWDKPGVYAVSVDAVDTSADGLVLSNANCDPGAKIQPQVDGVLTLDSAATAVAVTVGRFVEFETSPFLVTTPPSLVGATEAAVNVVLSYRVE
jgi:hypothetical protein